jgi:recombination protein RecT
MKTEITPRPAPKRPKKAKVPKGGPRADKPVEPMPHVSGYRGFMALALNSGQITSINVQAVHRNDRFDYAYGLDERLEHVPAEGDRGDVTHFYAYVKLKEGGHHFEVLPRAEVDAVRDRSESYKAYREGRAKDSSWVRDYAEMGKEIAIRRIAGYLPLALQKAAALDELGETVAALPEPEGLTQAEGPVPAQAPEPQAVSLTEEELAGLFPPGHIMRILDAAAERDMPDEVLTEIVGMSLDEIPPEDESAVLRTIASWQR